MKKILIYGVAMLMAAISTPAQSDDNFDTYMGLEMDTEALDKIPQKPRLVTRDYTSLPSRYSLMQYTPVPRSQGQYGTCTSWATTYAARTICEAVNNGWLDRNIINREAFGPLFIYHLIRLDNNSTSCERGTYIDQALRTLIDKGAPKYSDFDDLCVSSIPSAIYTKAAAHKLDDFWTIFNPNYSTERKIQTTKKSLSQGHPVVICMQVPTSFCRSHGKDLWTKTESVIDGGWHAMCVIGYDDNKYGGAFQIMNSWGTAWGNQGFIWVKYKDFADHVSHAYEPYLAKEVKPEPKPEPKPQPKPQPRNSFNGSMRFHLSTGQDMQPVRNNVGSMVGYKMNKPYISGTRYRIYLTNNEPAYVYVLGSDNTGAVSTVFPPDAKTSPALVYSCNNIALPDEKWFIEMDNTTGTDHVCVLYSKQALPIADIIKKIENAKFGTFDQKVRNALGDKAAGNNDIVWGVGQISFKGRSDATVVPVFVDITHN